MILYPPVPNSVPERPDRTEKRALENTVKPPEGVKNAPETVLGATKRGRGYIDLWEFKGMKASSFAPKRSKIEGNLKKTCNPPNKTLTLGIK